MPASDVSSLQRSPSPRRGRRSGSRFSLSPAERAALEAEAARGGRLARRATALLLLEGGGSRQAAANAAGLSLAAVIRLAKKAAAEGAAAALQDSPRSGRPRSISPDDRRWAAAFARQIRTERKGGTGRSTSYAQLAAMIRAAAPQAGRPALSRLQTSTLWTILRAEAAEETEAEALPVTRPDGRS